jgi:hypothetical protein
MSRIVRAISSSVLSIAKDAALSGVLDMRNYAGGVIIMPSAWTSASIGFYVCDTSDGTFVPLYDEDGSLVQISSPAASKAYSIPAEVYGAHYVKLWSQDGSGSNTTQAAARSLTVMLKG